jgi:mannan endo-1,4-beta-mannosidase
MALNPSRLFRARPTDETMKWGARIDGAVYGRSGDAPWDTGTWDLFEQHAGKRVSLVHWGQPLGAFDLSAADWALARGAMNMISYDTGGYSLSAIARGDADAKIDATAHGLAIFASVVWLRPWWEMNGTWFLWGRSADYAAAWRRLVTRTRAIAPMARFIWCPNTIWDTTSGELARWYPGSEYVDWMGVDGYNRNGPWMWAQDVFGPTMQKFEALHPTAPWAICETGCTEAGGSKANWIKNFLQYYLPHHKRFKALAWFNWNIKEGEGRRDWQIESSPAAQDAFRRGIASPHYVAGG